MPLRILRVRGLVGSSVVRGLLVTGMYSTFFLGTLYLEHVRHYSALQTGLAFLPWTLTVGALSLGITARLVARFGPLRVLIAGLVTVVAGLAAAQRPSGRSTELLPDDLLRATSRSASAIGSAFMPLLQIAMADVPAADAGLGSGIVNVSQQVAGALGLAVLGTVATDRTQATGSLLAGYHLAFVARAPRASPSASSPPSHSCDTRQQRSSSPHDREAAPCPTARSCVADAVVSAYINEISEPPPPPLFRCSCASSTA